MQQMATEKKPSGIPRLSRLPVPNSHSTGSSRRPQGHGRPGMTDLTVQKRRVMNDTSAVSTAQSGQDGGWQNSVPVHQDSQPSPEEVVDMSNAYVQAEDDNLRSIDGLSSGSDMRGPTDSGTGLSTANDLVKEDEGGATSRVMAKSKSRPSLAERTIQTISQIPPSPSPRRRRSSFYQTQSPMRPPSAAGTELGRTPRLTNIKPSSLSRSELGSPAQKTSVRGPPAAARSVSLSQKGPDFQSRLHPTIRPQSAIGNNRAMPSRALDKTNPVRDAKSGTLRGAGKVTGPRVPPIPSSSYKSPVKAPATVTAGRLANAHANPKHTQPKAEPLMAARNLQQRITSLPEDAQSQDDAKQPATSLSKAQKTSAALRETIAKAKAARKNITGKPSAQRDKNSIPTTPRGDVGVESVLGDLDLGGSPVVGKSLSQRIESARTDGRLDISVMGLRALQDEVLNMYSPEALQASRSAWYETVELTRFSAADNELEDIDPRAFPEANAEVDVDDENLVLFSSLESLDLHNNILRTIPPGLQCLENLTTLNLSHNKLVNDCLSIVVECRGLRDLNLAHNELSGELDPSVARLCNLVALDISDNALTAIPEELRLLQQLRTLKLSHNGLAQLSFDAIAELHLTELNASHNKLKAPLITAECEIMNSLQTLDLSSNRLTSLSESPCRFAALREINLSNNRLTSLPDLSGWDELLTMDLSDNQLSDIPVGFTSLRSVKQVSFRGNNIRVLDPGIGLMESLENLQLSGNPLRSRRALTLATEDLKRDLRSQLEPQLEEAAPEDAVVSAREDTDPAPQATAAEHQLTWPVRSGGIVDRSSSGLEIIDESILQATAAEQTIRRFELHHNLLTSIPLGISILATTLTELNLSHNKLDSQQYLTDPLDIPNLQVLNLSCNAISTLSPFLTHLSAGRLSTLDISNNALTTLPALRSTFPNLTSLLANDNRITDLSPELLKGLEMIDLRNNDIGHLPPKLGLLKEIRTLELGGNRFKVPSWSILQKGTHEVLKWLRGRIPADEMVGEEEMRGEDEGEMF